MILSYLTYLLLGYIWGIFLRNFWFSFSFLAIIQVFILLVFGVTITDIEFFFWLPLSCIIGLIVGTTLPYILNAPYFLNLESFKNECRVIKYIFQFIILNAILIFWEILPISPIPWGGTVQIILYVIALIVFYWANKYDFATNPYYHDNAFTLYWYWGTFMIPAIVAFTILAAVFPTVWPFWISVAYFVISTVGLIVLFFVLE